MTWYYENALLSRVSITWEIMLLLKTKYAQHINTFHVMPNENPDLFVIQFEYLKLFIIRVFENVQ
jgi:hypothetical protein